MNHAGSQLTFEKGKGGGAGITEKRDPRGVTTDLWEGGGVRGRNNRKTWPTRGHNWPFRCLDYDSEAIKDSCLWCYLLMAALPIVCLHIHWSVSTLRTSFDETVRQNVFPGNAWTFIWWNWHNAMLELLRHGYRVILKSKCASIDDTRSKFEMIWSNFSPFPYQR